MIGVPTKNSAEFLGECIQSIRSQTCESFRVLFLDGGSTDETIELIRSWEAEDDRVRLHEETVLGLYESFNGCIDLVEEPYFCILPADDLIAPTFLETMVAALEGFPDAAAAVCGLRVVDSEGRQIDSEFTDPITTARGFLNAEPLHDWPLDGLMGLLRRNPYVSQNQILYRTRSLGRRRFRCDLGTTADILFNLQTGLNQSVVHVDQTWAAWRVHSKQASQSEHSNAAKRAALETMIDTAISDHVHRFSTPGYTAEILGLADQMSWLNDFQMRSELRPRLRRWVALAAAMIAHPRVASLYFRDRFGDGSASRDWLFDRARKIASERPNFVERRGDSGAVHEKQPFENEGPAR